MEITKNKFACVLAFCGESGSGKSTIANIVKEALQQNGLQCAFATKYISGRKWRENEDPGVKIVDKIPNNCLIGNPREGESIGYDLDEIKGMISQGVFPIVITKDVQFLAKLAFLINDPNTNDTLEYMGRQLPVIRTRIYDVQSCTLSEKEIIELARKRYQNLSNEEISKEVNSRTTDWESYYRDRFGSNSFSEKIVNIKNFGLDYIKKYISKHVVGSENDEDTILWYINLWKEDEFCNNTGVILNKYRCLVQGLDNYNKKRLCKQIKEKTL